MSCTKTAQKNLENLFKEHGLLTIASDILTLRCLYHALENKNKKDQIIIRNDDTLYSLYINSNCYLHLKDLAMDYEIKKLMGFEIPNAYIKKFYNFCFFEDYEGEITYLTKNHNTEITVYNGIQLKMLQDFSNHNRAPNSNFSEETLVSQNKLNTITFSAEVKILIEAVDQYLQQL